MDSPTLASPLVAPSRRRRASGHAGDDAAGQSGVALGDWRLTAWLHEGERLCVYRARPITAGHGPGCYVLKTPAERFVDDPLAAALVRREARVASQVAHAHLTSVLGARLEGRAPLAILPYLDGITLRQMLTARAGDAYGAVASALWIARQLAAALAALHAAGWLHGQVRPEHVIVSPQGHATLIDLTQARRLETEECDAQAWPPSVLAYAAPEAFLARGRLTAASDVCSLGILLFELLTGQLPLVAAGRRQWAEYHLRRRPLDVREVRPIISRDIAHLVRQLLAKEPLRRPAAEQLVDRLAGLEIEELL
jgi:serine/threonine-protein kinase